MGKPIHDIEITQAGLHSSLPFAAIDENGNQRQVELAAERPLTIYLDKYEIVTLMTIGVQPELLTLGYLRNQGLIDSIEEVQVIQVDWETEAAAVVTCKPDRELSSQLAQRTVTTGCGQGTVFGKLMDKLKEISLPNTVIKQSTIYQLLDNLRHYNEVYKRAGAVHGCALCDSDGGIEFFVEDVGRHNAVDAIAGHMWLEGVEGSEKIFYTTGRLTSEMVIKVTQMGVPVLLSRSGATQMGLDMARQAGVTLISRAKGKHFLVLNGGQNLVFDGAVNVR